jgi:hypothetical protein
MVGKAELVVGIFALTISGALSVLADTDPLIDLKGLLALSPLLLGITGTLLVISGGNVLGNERYPYLMHIPLVLWFLVTSLILL